uniref:Uncharacterized protein n=1 Tax=Arundo donax TaxID=35708 RepID=A0A0A9E9M0_ARUDO
MVKVGFVGHLPIRSLSSQKELIFRLIARGWICFYLPGESLHFLPF